MRAIVRTPRPLRILLAVMGFALAGPIVPGSAHAAIDPSSACDQGVSAAYIEWAVSTSGAAQTPASAPVFDTGFPGVVNPGTYFTQGRMLIKRRSSDGGGGWAFCPPNIVNCTNLQGTSTINNFPAVVPMSTPGLHGCGGTPCVFVFFGASDGFLYKLDGASGTPALSADTRRKPGGNLACTVPPGDSLDATPAVVLYASASTDAGSRGQAFRADIDATPGHAGDDVVIVNTSNGCGDTTRNRIIAYWASNLTPKWIFNGEGEVKVDRGLEGCTVDYDEMRLYCGTDLADDATGQSSLFALDIITGALLWSTNAGAIRNRPTLNTGAKVLYVANRAGTLMAYDPAGYLGGAAPRWSAPVGVAGVGTFIRKSPAVEPGAGSWQNRILVMDTGGTLHAVADCDVANAPAGCSAGGKLLWSGNAHGTGVTFKSRPIVSPGLPSRAYIGRSDGYMQMLELSDADLLYRGVVTANASAPMSAEVFDPSFDAAGSRVVVVSGTRLTRMQRDPALQGQGDPNELFCAVAPYGNAGCTTGGIGGNSCNRPQFDQYNPCLIYTCNASPSICLKVTSVKPTGMVPNGTSCNDDWSGGPRGPRGVCTSSTLRNTTTTDANCASTTCPGCVAAPNPPYFLGKACTTNTECWPCRTAANAPVNTTNSFCRCPSGPLLDPIPCNVPLSGVCVCNSASMAANLTNQQALDLCNDACIDGTCSQDTDTSCGCFNPGDPGCSGNDTCCGALDGGCVDLLNDPEHCGSCSTSCNIYYTPGTQCATDGACTEQPNGSCGFTPTITTCAVDSDCTAFHGPNSKCSGGNGSRGTCYVGWCRYLLQAGSCVQGVCADLAECTGPDVSDLIVAAPPGMDALAFSRTATCDAFVTAYRSDLVSPDPPCGAACADDSNCGVGGDCTNGSCCPAGTACRSGICRAASVQTIASGGSIGYFTTDGDPSRLHGVGVLPSGTTAFGAFVNDPVSAGVAGLAVARNLAYNHPLASGPTIGAANEPFAATEFDRGPVGPAVDTSVSSDADWTVYFGNFVAGTCTDRHLCRVTGSNASVTTTTAVTWINQPCVEPLPGDGFCAPAAELSPERITALAFAQLRYSPPDIYHRYLIVAHGTTLSFLDLDAAVEIPAQQDIDLTNPNIYDPTTPSAAARGESTPTAVLSIAVVPYGDLVIEVRGTGSNANRFLLNIDANDRSARNQRSVQRDILGMHPCGAGGTCPVNATCVQGACLPTCGSCPDGSTCTFIGGGTCDSPIGGGNPVCCIDNAVPGNFGITDGRLSVTPEGQLLRFVPSAANASPANWDFFQLTRADACTGTIGVVNDSVRVAGSEANVQVTWTDGFGPFNLYRGSISGGVFSYNHTCLAQNVPGPVSDNTVPTLGTSLYYLVTRVTPCGESAPGQGIPNPNPCP